MRINPLLATDFYKADHRNQYPEGTEYVYSNFTPRSDRLFNAPQGFDHKVVFFGLQAFINTHLIGTWNEGFFSRDKQEVIDEYQAFMDASLGEGAITTEHIAELHDLGYLPIAIEALPEGSRVNMQVPVFVVCNTDKRFFWLTNFLETWMSNEIWKTCTAATIANEYRRILEGGAERTGSAIEFVDVQGHDFSCRGMSGMVDASFTGMGHLTSFIGTDTQTAIQCARENYGEGVIGVSVPATEHSVMCAGGMDDEFGTFKRLIVDLYPSGVVSIVSDTWDFWKVITEFTVELKDEILNRTPNAIGLAKTVFRPDSGDPVEIICGIEIEEVDSKYDLEEWAYETLRDNAGDGVPHGERGEDNITEFFKQNGKTYKASAKIFWNRYDKQYYYVDEIENFILEEVTLSAEEKGAVECLWDVFGGTTNEKGFRTIHERVGLIYGDSITLERAEQILRRLEAKGFAADNIVFGIGSYTYQYLTRDTFGFAMKATWCQINGEPRMIQKSPKTDAKKKSAKGLMWVERVEDDYVLHDGYETVHDMPRLAPNEMREVFRDGKAKNTQSFTEIRERLASER